MPRIRATIAHSPDADDAFMFYALSQGKGATGKYEVTHLLNDIETLNRAAEKGTYEVTAISYHQYPYVARDYAMTCSGGSFGEGYGPVVVARKDLSRAELARTVIAIPGERTSATLALRLCLPGVKTVAMPFDKVQPAVAAGEIEAGVIIHEGQLSFGDDRLRGVLDLGDWWKAETGLPLPLGGNAVRKDLGWIAMAELGALIRDTVAYALAHREEALTHALSFARGLDRGRADRFVGMYVNDRTLDLGADGKKSVQLFLERAYEAKLIPMKPVIEFVETAKALRRWP